MKNAVGGGEKRDTIQVENLYSQEEKTSGLLSRDEQTFSKQQIVGILLK